MITAATSRHVALVSRVLLQRFKPPTIIPKLDKISVRIHDPKNQAQWFAKVRATGTACFLASIVYRHSQHFADYGRLVVGWHNPVLKSRLPSNELSLLEYVRLVHRGCELSNSPSVFCCPIIVGLSRYDLDKFRPARTAHMMFSKVAFDRRLLRRS